MQLAFSGGIWDTSTTKFSLSFWCPEKAWLLMSLGVSHFLCVFERTLFYCCSHLGFRMTDLSLFSSILQRNAAGNLRLPWGTQPTATGLAARPLGAGVLVGPAIRDPHGKAWGPGKCPKENTFLDRKERMGDSFMFPKLG